MDVDSLHDTTVSVVEGDPDRSNAAVSSSNGILEESLSDKEVMRAVGRALSRLELHLACCSEKLVNMNLLMMYVAEKENIFEVFTSGKEESLVVPAEDALEFDILSGIFDSEVREMDNFIGNVQIQIKNAHDMISSHKHLIEVITTLEDKLHDAETSLKKSQEQVSELMMQSVRFQRIISSTYGGKADDTYGDIGAVENGDFLAKLHMQTSGQQRHLLRMLEKSLARELELENQLTECKEALDRKKLKVFSSQQRASAAEEDTAIMYGQFLEADSASAVLMGISKDFIGQLQSCQLKINSALRRENDLNAKLQNYAQAVERLENEGAVLKELAEKSNLEALALTEKVNSLEEQLKASGTTLLNGNASPGCINELHEVKALEEKVVIAESRAEKSEAECQLLSTTNQELKEELELLKGSGISDEKFGSLEKLLMETDLKLQLATASVEASEEREKTLNDSIRDMEIVMEELKSKVLSAEARAEKAESACSLLEEANVELTNELDILKANDILNEKVLSLEKQVKETNCQLQEATAYVEASQEKQSMLYRSINDMEKLIEKLKSKVLEADARADSAEDKCILLSESHGELDEELNFLRDKVEGLEASLQQAEESKFAAAKDITMRTKVVTDLVMQLAVERERLQKQIVLLKVDKQVLVHKLQTANPTSPCSVDHEVVETENKVFTSERKGRISSDTTKVHKSAEGVIYSESSSDSEEMESKLESVRTINATSLSFKYILSASLIAVIAVLATCSFLPENCPF